MPDKTKLLTPDDEVIKERLATKYHRIWSSKEFQNKIERLTTCKHPSIYYSMEEQWFKCKKCDEKLVFCNLESYRMFCGFLRIPLTKFTQ